MDNHGIDLSSKIRIEKRFQIMLISIFSWGIIAHGYRMFNELTFNDDLSCSFYLGSTVSWGRWFLRVVWDFLKWLIQGDTISEPVVNGVLTMLMFALAGCIILKMFRIFDPLLIITLGGLMITFPAVTSMMDYNFMAPVCGLNILMCTIGAYLIVTSGYGKGLLKAALGSVIITLAIGLYQAFFVFSVCLILLYFLFEISGKFEAVLNGLRKDVTQGSFGWFFISAIKYLGFLLAAIVLYVISCSIFERIYDAQMVEIEGIGSFGMVSLPEYINRIKEAYYVFFHTLYTGLSAMFPGGLHRYYWLVLLLGMILTVIVLMSVARKQKVRVIQYLIVLIMMPFATNLLYVMAGELDRGLAVYPQITPLIYLILLINTLGDELSEKNKKWFGYAGVLLLLWMTFLFIRFDNGVYKREDYYLKSTDRFYTSLITRIQNTEGYKDTLPVAYIGEFGMRDETLVLKEEFDAFSLDPNYGIMINDYAWRTYMQMKQGFYPDVVEDTSIYQYNEEVKEMPCYPDAGSIKVIDDVVVVKFTEYGTVIDLPNKG